MKKPVLWGTVAGSALLLAIIGWAFIASTQPLPGIEELQNNRTHIPDGSKTNYIYNPPTSGAHYPDWLTKGFYTEPRADGYVVHSQEHGYIIIWYDCEKKETASLISTVYAADASSTATTSNSVNGPIPMAAGGSEGTPSATLAQLPAAFRDGSCNQMESELKNVYNTLGPHKLIIMPRVGMDSPIILTAWGRAEKLTHVDTDKIKAFIAAFRDNGPEPTVEN